MRYFQRIATGVDVLPLCHALARKHHLFNQHRLRTTFPNTPHAEVDDMVLRYSDPEQCPTAGTVMGAVQNVWYPAWKELPEARPIISALMHRVGGYELGRVLVSKIRPGKRVLPHADDEGEYVHLGDIARYHIVLQGLPGALFRTGDEVVSMRTGEVWWFDAHAVHEIVNNSQDDRIHLIADVRLLP